MQTLKKSYHHTLANYFTAQPLYWDGEKQQRPNIRKLIEQPFQLANAEMKGEWEKTLLEYEFLQEKVESGLLGDLLDDYERMEVPGEEVRLVGGAVRLSAHVLRIDKGQLASQMYGRLIDREEIAIVALKGKISRIYKRPWIKPLHACMTQPGGALLKTLSGHTDIVAGVNGVGVTPDGSLAVSASCDKTLKVWDVKSGKELKTLSGHTSVVCGVSVTSDGTLAVSASYDKTLKVWDLKSGKELRTLSGHTRGVAGVSVTPDGSLAVSASWDKTLKVWDLKSGKELKTLSGHNGGVNGVSMTPDGTLALAVSASRDSILNAWDLKSGKELKILSKHTDFFYNVSLTADGSLAVSVSGHGYWHYDLKVWDIRSGKELKTLIGHTDDVYCVSVTPDGSLAVSASDDKTLKVWDLRSGKELISFDCDEQMWCCAITPDGRTIVAGGASGVVYFLRLENFPIESKIPESGLSKISGIET